MFARSSTLAHGLLVLALVSTALPVIGTPSKGEAAVAQLAEVEYEDPLGFVVADSDLACKNTGNPTCDPGNVDGAGDFPTITFTPVTSVPQPSTGLLLLCAGIAAMVMRRYGWQAR